MATVAGALSVDLSVNSASFVRDMGRASRAVNSNAAKMNKSLAKLDRGFLKARKSLASFAKRTLSLRGAVATLAGGAGLGLLAKRSIDAADSIAKVADATGVSTDALQEFRFAADLAGVSAESWDKALKFATKSVGELKTRVSSELSTALKDYDAELLANIKNSENQEQVIALVVRALEDETDASKKAALAKAFFGRAGIDLVNIANDEAGAFERGRAQARALGTVLREDLVRGAVQSKDELTRLTTQIDTNATRIGVALAPALILATRLFADFTQSIFDAGAALQSAFAPSAQQQLESLEAKLAALKAAAAKPAAPAGQLFASSAKGMGGRRGSIAGALSGPGNPQRRPGTGGGGNAITIVERQIAALKELIALQDEAAAPPAPAPVASSDIIGSAKGLAQATEAANEALAQRFRLEDEAAEAAASRALTVVRAGETAVEAYNREIEELKKLRADLAATGQAALLSEQQFGRAADQALERLKERQDAEAEARRATDEMAEAQRGLARSFDVIDDALAGNMDIWQAWASVAVREIQRVLDKLLEGESAGSSGGILGAIIKIGASLFGGGGPGALPDSAGFAESFSHGGRVRAGQLAIVGENGPEILVPDSAGTIIPNSALGGGGTSAPAAAGVTNIYNIDAREATPGVEQRIIQALQDLDRSIEPRAVNAVANARGRGGSFARAFGSL